MPTKPNFLQSKKDLGFIEGDLIECLNAGDGAWWTGRLRRDRRMIGLFPSNFVTVLDDSFQPAPIAHSSSTRNLAAPATPQKSRSTFRKPFQAYEKLDASGSVSSSTDSSPNKPDRAKSRWAPYSSMKTAQAPGGTVKKHASSSPLKEESTFRVPSPPPRSGVGRMKSRAHSPAPPPAVDSQSSLVIHRPRSAMSFTPAQDVLDRDRDVSDEYDPETHYADEPDYRSPSPYDMDEHEYHDSKAPSPQPYKLDEPEDSLADVPSSPAPPPPPHRVVYKPSHTSLAPDVQDPPVHHHLRSNSPLHSPGLTPSPLRDAMNDVMSSLHDMTMTTTTRNPSPAQASTTPLDPWSPEAFDQLRTSPLRHPRSQTSSAAMRHTPSAANRSGDRGTSSSTVSQDAPPQLSNYVQRMEHRLRHAKSAATELSHARNDQTEDISETFAVTSQANTDVPVRTLSQRQKSMLNRRSAYELSSVKHPGIQRTYTTKTSVTSSSSGWRSNATTNSNTTQSTSHTLSSVSSAGAYSATSAGSFARRKWGIGGSIRQKRPMSVLSSRLEVDEQPSHLQRPASPMSGPSYHSSHATQPAPTPVADWNNNPMDSAGVLGGMGAPRAKKSGFFKKMIATAKITAKTGAANARSTISSSSHSSRPTSRAGGLLGRTVFPDGVTAISSNQPAITSSAHRDMGLGGDTDWMQVRRDVNRTNSLSRNERNERAERCAMLDVPVLNPVDEFHDQVEGDESMDGLPVTEPTDFNTTSLSLVDKSTRFIAALPASVTPAVLAQSYLCRQYRSDVQRLRAIFTWVAERVSWEEDIEGEIDTRRVLQTKRGCTAEIASLVRELCAAVGLHAEVVRGHLKIPGEALDLDMTAGPNHWWNAVLVDGEWRIMDCALAGPTNPKRSAYSCAGSNVAENWWFLARPTEICYTHVPVLPEQQHICPPAPQDILMALPCACPPYFKHRLELADFSTSALYLDNLDMAHVQVVVPEDVECVAEVEARAFAHDCDGDLFESGDVVRKPALSQAQWVAGRKVFSVKAVLPGDEGQGVLKIYAGKRGLMVSVNVCTLP